MNAKDVLIAGAGPTGLSLACGLLEHGVVGACGGRPLEYLPRSGTNVYRDLGQMPTQTYGSTPTPWLRLYSSGPGQ